MRSVFHRKANMFQTPIIILLHLHTSVLRIDYKIVIDVYDVYEALWR